jgi:3-phosphoglycerate kinase
VSALDEVIAELARIKEGIKTADRTLIVDGNDMADWGWSTTKNRNAACYEAAMQIIHGANGFFDNNKPKPSSQAMAEVIREVMQRMT